MRDGRTLIQRIYDDHFEGCERAEKMAETLRSLDLPEADKQEAQERMRRQLIACRVSAGPDDQFCALLFSIGP